MNYNLPKRSLVRKYIKEMLKAELATENVYTTRVSPVSEEELPLFAITFEKEQRGVSSGSKIRPKIYDCVLPVTITIIVPDIALDGKTTVEDERGLDFADYLGEKIERLFARDWDLSRRLPGYDPDVHNTGLIKGHHFTDVASYDVATESGLPVVAQELMLTLMYDKDGFVDLNLPDFKTYSVQILKFGATEETPDPILTEALGGIQDE